MTIKHEIETLSFVFIASALATIGIGLMHRNSHEPLSVVAPFTNILPTATPTPTSAPVPETTYTSQTSSDGKEKITMKDVNVEGAHTYTLSVTNVETNTTTPLFTENDGTSSSIKIPFNTFSPDNKFLFLEKDTQGVSHFLLFQTTGENFGNGSQYIDATEAFTSYTSDYTHPQVTGWGDNALLIINAKDAVGHSASFWMEVPSGNFIPLSTYFP